MREALGSRTEFTPFIARFRCFCFYSCFSSLVDADRPVITALSVPSHSPSHGGVAEPCPSASSRGTAGEAERGARTPRCSCPMHTRAESSHAEPRIGRRLWSESVDGDSFGSLMEIESRQNRCPRPPPVFFPLKILQILPLTIGVVHK